MVKRMLIDATHPEETRVVVVNGTRLEELDVETSTKKQLKGNIYLAKIVRVEPSLQAAFVDYGGNRHGFLAFSEIHPDYFQIPVADRQALLAAQRAEVMREGNGDHHEPAEPAPAEAAAAEGEGAEPAEGAETPAPTPVESLGGDEVSEQEMERRRARLLRNYKIQEVIKRRQIMLVQVVKEERGNKGAALTTYLSLAGRYCVLMPNTARGGGVSRKIINANDRRRLKAIANELDIPDGMATIIRTAGSERSKAEIKRDYEYLLRAWDSVRELTLSSSAPALVYEEASLIKRSIRDLYSRDIDEVAVEGEEGYRLAKDYMRMLTPSHAKKVQPYRDPVMPLFHRYQVESQLDAMHSPVVQLRSGGYIVISQTEALVAIDVNSGRATKERHIEETAVKTNLEAAEEIARQLRLRDLAGLIVIDFIDMEENRNNHAVERRLKEALKNDRARIQVGKISAFGLLELSRQRLRPSLQETTFTPCPHCAGTGLVRGVESAAVHVLRAIEEEGIRQRSSEVTVFVATPIALYILNQKRDALAAIEARYQFRVLLQGDDELISPNYRMERVKAEFRPEDIRPVAISMDANIPAAVAVEEDEADEEEAEEAVEAVEVVAAEGAEAAANGEADSDGEGRKRRRRRRRKRRGGEAAGNGEQSAEGDGEAAEGEHAGAEEDEAEGDADDEGDAEGDEGGVDANGETAEERRKRRRGRRGGRRRRRNGDRPEVVEPTGPQLMTYDAVADVFEAAEAAELAAVERRLSAPAVAGSEGEAEAEAAAEAPSAQEEPAAGEEKPKRRRAPRAKPASEAAPAPAAVAAEGEVIEGAAAEEKPKRSRKKAEPKEPKEPKPKAEPKPRKAKAKPEEAEGEEKVEAKPKRSRAKKAAPEAAPAEAAPAEAAEAEPVAAEVEAPQAPQPAPVETEAAGEPSDGAPAMEAAAPVEPSAPAQPPRRGWWNR